MGISDYIHMPLNEVKLERNRSTNGYEISDLIVQHDPATLQRLPVSKADVIVTLRTAGDTAAQLIVERFPEEAGILDAEFVDRQLIAAHCEIQRLSEEFCHGERMAQALLPLVAALYKNKPLRIVDVGCGTGFVIRWLAAHRPFDDRVELTGVDFNSALIAEAQRLAEVENLKCRFAVGNALESRFEADILISTGVLHHFRGQSLTDFFSSATRVNGASVCSL